MLIDTHCHLDAAEFDTDRDAVYAAARAAGVAQLIIPAVAVDGFTKTKTIAARYPGCHAAYGIHPLYVMQAGEDDLDQLRTWLIRERPIAIGEIGLDFHRPNTGCDAPDPARQLYFFTAQLRLARELDLPILLHVRRAIDPILRELRRIRVPGGIAHAFNGSPQQAGEFLKLGFRLGFGGTLTYSGSTRIRALACELPVEAIVLETDAPDIPPAWRPRERNSPSELRRIAETLAELRGASPDEIMARTSENARLTLPGL